MKLGVPKESVSGENRVAMVPEVVQRLGRSGVDVVVEAGAGAGARIPDQLYTDAGATIGDPWAADVVVKVAPPTDAELGRLNAGSVIVDMAGDSGGNCELTQAGETVVEHDVKIIAPLNLPSQMAESASMMYARNIQALVELMVDDEGNLALDWNDEVIAKSCVAGKKEPAPVAAEETTA